jgi:hypothetical protein
MKISKFDGRLTSDQSDITKREGSLVILRARLVVILLIACDYKFTNKSCVVNLNIAEIAHQKSSCAEFESFHISFPFSFVSVKHFMLASIRVHLHATSRKMHGFLIIDYRV